MQYEVKKSSEERRPVPDVPPVADASPASSSMHHAFGDISLVPPVPRSSAESSDEYAAIDRRITREAREREFASAAPGEIYEMVGPGAKWREHIDAAHHGLGKNVYVEGLHGKKPDPNYNRAMMDADRHVRSTFGRQFTFDDYHRTHALAIADKGDEYGSRFRLGELPVGTRENAFNASPEELATENVAPFGGAAHVPPLVKSFTPSAQADDGRAKVVLADIVKGGNPQDVYRAHITNLLGAYYERVGAAESPADKLAAIAHLHKSLENLHPYGDANTRTNRLVLNRMLAEQRMAPTMLDQPLDVHHTKAADWVKHIQSGQERWKDSAFARTGSSVAKQWTKWEKGVKTEAGRHDRMPDSILKRESNRGTVYHTNAPELSRYSAPVPRYVAPQPQAPPQPQAQAPVDRSALIERLTPIVLRRGMNAEGFASMSTEQLLDLERMLS